MQRVNRAIDHVLVHLDQPLNLERVAQAAGFSPFHFHRVFRAMVGETLAQFVKRLRLDRALARLSADPDRSLTEVALDAGFGSSSDFSRSFKQRFGVPPRAFDVQAFRRQRRAEWQVAVGGPEQHRLDRLPEGQNPDGFEVQLRRLRPRSVAYLRVLDSYRPGAVERAARRLESWAEARGLADGQWLGYMWDDPELVAPGDCRYDIAVEIGPGDEVRLPDGDVCRFDFPAMRVAQIELFGDVQLELRALDWFYRTWLPPSGYLPTDQPGFEAFVGRPFAHGNETFELVAQIPVAHAGSS